MGPAEPPGSLLVPPLLEAILLGSIALASTITWKLRPPEAWPRALYTENQMQSTPLSPK